MYFKTKHWLVGCLVFKDRKREREIEKNIKQEGEKKRGKKGSFLPRQGPKEILKRVRVRERKKEKDIETETRKQKQKQRYEKSKREQKKKGRNGKIER